MIDETRSKHVSLVALLMFAGLVALSLQVFPVLADVPSIENVEHWMNGTNTILNITVRHGSPTGSHFVNIVEVDIDGAIQSINNLSSQTTTTFIVQYNMGEVVDTPTVEARAHCTFHGWSSWSEPVVVPELLPIHLLMALTILPVAVLLLRSRTPRSVLE